MSQLEMGQLPQNEKQPYRLNTRPQMWQSILILAMTLALNFQGQIFNLYISETNRLIAKKWKTNILSEC